MELFGKLGINAKLLLAQMVNFFILLYVLRRFAYKPILKVLDDRKRSIEKGLGDALKAEQKLLETEDLKKRVLADARQEARMIFVQAEKSAQEMKNSIVESARMEANRMMEDAKNSISQEKQKMLEEARSEIAGLVVLAMKKISDIKMDEKADAELIKQVLSTKESI